MHSHGAIEVLGVMIDLNIMDVLHKACVAVSVVCTPSAFATAVASSSSCCGLYVFWHAFKIVHL